MVPIGAIALFAANLCAALALMGSGDRSVAAAVILLIAFCVFSVAYSLLFVSRRPRPSAFSASVYLGYGLLLPAIYQTRTGNFPWNLGYLDNAALVPAAILTLFSVLLFFIGALRQRHDGPVPPRGEQAASGKAAIARSGAALIVSLVVLAICIAGYGIVGGEAFRATREGLSVAASNAQLGSAEVGLFVTFPRGLAIGSLILSGFLIMRGRRDYATVLSMLLTIVSNALVNFPTSLPRFMLLAIAFVLILTVFQKIYMKFHRYLFYIFPIALYGIFPFLGGFNRYSEMDLTFTHPGLAYLESGDLDGFQSTVNAISYVAHEGLFFGRVLVSAALFFVPRDVWSGKLEPSGTFVSKDAGYSFVNISMPLPAELYLDGWFLLAFAGMFLVGRFSALADRQYATIATKQPLMAMMSILLCAYFPILLRGTLMAIVGAAAASAGVFLLWWFLCRMSGRVAEERRVRPNAAVSFADMRTPKERRAALARQWAGSGP